MLIHEAIHSRRSVKKFTDRVVTPAEIEALLSVVPFAPNHRLTQPWRFHVLGPEARGGYGAALGARKARKVDDPAAASELVQKIADEHRALPAMIVFSVVRDDNPEIAEENYAAAMMGIQNFCLAAVAAGLGTHIKTGAIMDDPAARAAVGLPDNERVIAVVNLGEPAELPAAKPRASAADYTSWPE